MLGIFVAAALMQASVSDLVPALCSINNSVPETCSMMIVADEVDAGVGIAIPAGVIFLGGPINSDQKSFTIRAISVDGGELASAFGTCRFTPGVLRCSFVISSDPNEQFNLEVVNPNVQP